MPLSTFYAPRIRIPSMLQRGKTQTVSLSIYRDNAKVAPTGCTYQLLDEDGTDIISASAGTIVSDDCTFTINSSVVPTSMDLSDGLYEIWEVTIDAIDYTFQRPAYLCRRPLYPVVSQIDLESCYSDLANLLPSSYTNGYQTWIDEAWVRIVERLRQQGNLPYLITDPQTLRGPHLELALALIWRNMHSAIGTASGYLDLYQTHIKSYEYQWKQLSFRYDMDEDGVADNHKARKAAQPIISTSNPPRFGYFWNRRY